MNRRFLACALLWLATPTCYAADLLAFYREATVSDPTFASSRQSLLANREKIPQGRSLLLPQVTLNANILYNKQTVVESPYQTVDLQYPSRTFTLQLTQPLFRWANWQTYKQDELLVAQAEAQYAQAEEDLIVRVAQAYFDVLNARDTIDFLKAQKQAISEQLESAKRNFDVGTATITDTNEAEARYDLADAQEIAAQGDYEVKQAALQQIVGHPPGVLASLLPGVHLATPAPARLADWLSSAESSNPQIAQAEANFQVSERQVEISKSARYPSLDVIAERSFQRSPTSILPPELGSNAQNSIGIQLSVPLFTGGYNSSKITEALALSEKANDDLEASRRAADQNVRQAFVGVINGLAQVKALEAAEVSSNSALESNKLGYQVGIRINIDVLNAQQQLFSTKRDLAKARYDTLVNSLKLKAAAGTLAEPDVIAVNVLLEH